jgi:hypothetical protein
MTTPEQEGGFGDQPIDAETVEYLAEKLTEMAAEVRKRAPSDVSWAIIRGVKQEGARRDVRDVAEFKCEIRWPEES